MIKPEVSTVMVAMKVMVVKAVARGVPRLPTLKVPLAVAATRFLGVPGRGLADEIPKPAHSQGLSQVIIILLYIWTQGGLLQGHPDLQAREPLLRTPSS